MTKQAFECPDCWETHATSDATCCGSALTCAHKWKAVSDWIGDANVDRGTMSFHYWRCEWCDETTDEEPRGWHAPEREFDKMERT